MLEVPKVCCSLGMYSQKIAMMSANSIAGNRYQFCVAWLKTGGCWKILNLRVRSAIRENHCMTTRLTKYILEASLKPDV